MKACPFCGGKAILETPLKIYVRCERCEARAPRRAWQNRLALAQAKEEL